jgi:hypothetical protein
MQIDRKFLNKSVASVAPQMANGIKSSIKPSKFKVLVAFIASDRIGTPRSSSFFSLFHLVRGEVRVPDDAYLDSSFQYGFAVDF